MLSNLWAKIRPVVQFRIQRWHVAMRGYTEQNTRVIVDCESDIWYWVLAEVIFCNFQTHICHWLHNISLPGFMTGIRGHWDKDDPEYYASFGDWFGDDVGSIWHYCICDPCLQFVWKHKNPNQAAFELTLDEARAKFAHDPKQYQWVEKEIAEHKQYDIEKTEEIRAKYRRGELTREEALRKLSFVYFDDSDDRVAEVLDKATN